MACVIPWALGRGKSNSLDNQRFTLLKSALLKSGLLKSALLKSGLLKSALLKSNSRAHGDDALKIRCLDVFSELR